MNYYSPIYCCGCKEEVVAELIKGKEVYPHRKDLYDLYFWRCPNCKNFVGTHKGTIRPLGCIATKELKQYRMGLHDILDPIWKSGKVKRAKLYKQISKYLGYEYHTANTKSKEEVDKVKEFLIKNYL